MKGQQKENCGLGDSDKLKLNKSRILSPIDGLSLVRSQTATRPIGDVQIRQISQCFGCPIDIKREGKLSILGEESLSMCPIRYHGVSGEYGLE